MGLQLPKVKPQQVVTVHPETLQDIANLQLAEVSSETEFYMGTRDNPNPNDLNQ